MLHAFLRTLKWIDVSDCVIDPENPGPEIPHKAEVVIYLRSKAVAAVSYSYEIDGFTGERIPSYRRRLLYDDKYFWSSVLAYYVEKYNAALPPDFLAHIYSRCGVKTIDGNTQLKP